LNSTAAIIVVHEIYGINEHMKRVCETLTACGFDVFCPNLLDQASSFDYSEEAKAYSYFMENVGFTHASAAIRKLVSDIKEKYAKIYIVGFSVGATVAWLSSEDRRVDRIVGYYGSRIRDYMDIAPQCPVLLFYPQEEISFHVDELISVLHGKPIVEVQKLEGQHGFSDPFSPKYNEQSAEKAWNLMLAFLRGRNSQ